MMLKTNTDPSSVDINWTGVAIILGVILLTIILITGWSYWGYPQYHVWEQGMIVKARLAEADSSKQIAIAEAHAKMEASKMYAQAEIERAKGVAEANKIIGESLKGNEAYLNYLFINGLNEKDGHEVIYIPTEAGMPILEAGRLHKQPSTP